MVCSDMTDEIVLRLKELETARRKLSEQIESSLKALQELDERIAATRAELEKKTD